MKKILLGKFEYEIKKNHKECLQIDELSSLYTDYFEPFDYILGDYSYNKLRLKGFYNKTNKKVKDYNNIDNLE